MIKFFRHFRQAMIKDPSESTHSQEAGNRISKYMLYAFGEIVLVVIGILIALQVNEWNKERNRNKAEEITISQLRNDLEISAIELEEIKEFYLTRTRACAEVTRAFYKFDTPHDSIEYALRIPLSSRIYSPILGTARSLINSGNIDRLSSTQLKNDLISYVEKVDYMLKDISRYEQSYYRKGVELVHEAMPTTFRSVEFMNERQQRRKDNSPDFQEYFDLNMNMTPMEIERIPFRSNLSELFQDKKMFNAYAKLNTAHRNIYFKYDAILSLTAELLDNINND